MKDANDPPPSGVRRLGPISSISGPSWYDWRDDLRLPDIQDHGEPGTVEHRVRGLVRYIVTELDRRVAIELKQEPRGRWPQMRRGMLLDIQQHLRDLTLPVIPLELRKVPLEEHTMPAEILGYGDKRTVEMQLGNMSADMRLLALGLDRLDMDDADELAAWLRRTADDLDPWGGQDAP